MPHESSEDSSNQPDGPKGSPRCPPPIDPLGPLNRSLDFVEDPSNVTADAMGHLTPPP